MLVSPVCRYKHLYTNQPRERKIWIKLQDRIFLLVKFNINFFTLSSQKWYVSQAFKPCMYNGAISIGRPTPPPPPFSPSLSHLMAWGCASVSGKLTSRFSSTFISKQYLPALTPHVALAAAHRNENPWSVRLHPPRPSELILKWRSELSVWHC